MKANPLNLMLAENYSNQEPTGYWISEKLDGVFARWDGKQLLSKEGNVFNCPKSFIENFPKNIKLEGELFIDRGMLQQTISTIKSSNWDQLQFMIFDVPTTGPFPDRLFTIPRPFLPNHVRVIAQTRCRSKKHLQEFEQKIIDMGGEGVVLRPPNSLYVSGRTQNILKLKRRATDEAIIIDYQGGHSKHFPVIESLICKWGDKFIKVGSGLTQLLKENPPEIGKEITFSYFGLTDSGQPRETAFVAVRDYE